METTRAPWTNTPVIGDQRPPGPVASTPRTPPPRSALRKAHAGNLNVALANALGWLSVGVGAAQLAAPRAVARAVGAHDHVGLVRAFGAREVANGLGLLSGRQTGFFLWARVAGDVMDLAALGTLLAQGRGRSRTIAATAAVAAVTALDVYAANRVREQGVPAEPQRDRTVRVEKTVWVNRPPQQCYALWRDVGSFPQFMKSVDAVRREGGNRFHWVARTPGGATIEWDAEITNDQPGQLIAWRSVDEADVQHAGVVRFEPDRSGRGTLLRVEIQYLPPGGALGAMFARLADEVPSQTIEEDIRRFKRLAETGEVPTIAGQSHGRRSLLYGLMRKGRA